MREVDDAKTKTARHTETVYGVTSSAASSKVLLAASRGHWQIESVPRGHARSDRKEIVR